MKHSHILNIPIVDAYKVDPIDHCRTIRPFVDIDGYRLFIINNADVFTEEWLANLPVPLQDTSLVFVREPHSTLGVHQDYFPPDRGYMYALNYILQGPEDSRMIYYETPFGAPTPLPRYPNCHLNVAEEVIVPTDRLLLVDTTVYHSVHVGSSERWCMSLRPIDATYDGTNFKPWEEIISQYGDYTA